jgi:enoyl-CoA hydratase/carnithine racemase
MQLDFADAALTLHLQRQTAVLTLQRPASRNAINAAMWRALPAALAAAAARQARVLVLRGDGGDFAAGADIAEFDTVFASRAATLQYAMTMGSALQALADWPGATLALIEGHCIGAGLALALACDLRCAATDARLGVTPAKLGLLLSLADTRRLVRAVGGSQAREMLYTARLFDAHAALGMGLVDELHAGPALAAAVFDKADLIASQSAWSVRHTKAVLGLVEAGMSDDNEQARNWFADAVETPEYVERLRAFRQRRKPA